LLESKGRWCCLGLGEVINVFGTGRRSYLSKVALLLANIQKHASRITLGQPCEGLRGTLHHCQALVCVGRTNPPSVLQFSVLGETSPSRHMTAVLVPTITPVFMAHWDIYFDNLHCHA